MAATSTPNAEDAVVARLDADRRDLLDLSLRNPLLNYRPRSRGLEFRGESAAQVFRVLAVEGKRMAFLPGPAPATASEQGGASPEQPTGDEAGPEGPGYFSTDRADLKLQTDLAADALQPRLLAIFHASRATLEEQGVNTLFLVAGMLRWFEADDRGRARPLRAPLLLVPVEIERSTARERFRLRAGDEDPEVNLSLIAKLRADFGIELPESPDAVAPAGDDPDARDAAGRYFDAVDEVLRAREGWEVERGAVVLGFFSFGKFLMYHDLDGANWPAEARPSSHPVLRSLLHEGFREPRSPVGDDGPLDDIPAAAEPHQVVDADSTQLLALLDVAQGRNLVIQGPPGTGKSQTIVNLIAGAIGRGKTVLFVAEKLAALDVVKRRLDAVGLGDACLELHSHKTRKKAVLDELRRTLTLGRPKLEPADDDLMMLAAVRVRLNAYCQAVNAPIGSSGLTPYQAYGALLLLRDRRLGAAPAPLEIPGLSSWSSYELKRRQALIEELQSRLEDVGVPREHPFWGSRRRVLMPTETDRLRDLILAARAATDSLRAAAGRLASFLRLEPPAAREGIDKLLRASKRASKAVQLAGADLASADWDEHRGDLTELLDAGSQLEQLHQRFDDVLVPEAWDEDLREVRERLNSGGRSWWGVLMPGYRRAYRTLAGLCRSAPPRRLDDQLELIDAVLSARRRREVVRRHDPLARRLFRERWEGERSNWAALGNLARWTWQLHHDVRTHRLPAGIIAFLAGSPPLSPLEPLAAAVKEALAAQLERLNVLIHFLEYDAESRPGAVGPLRGLDFDAIEALLQTWSGRTGDLPALVGFNHLSRRCREEGLDGVVALAESWPEAARHLADAFRRHWYESLLHEAFATRPALAGFEGRGHEHAIALFCDLDLRVIRHNRARLTLEHRDRLPRHEGGGQLAVLRREFEKKSRHLPLRTLLARAGNAVRAIKPVFLMSPLSVASYLAPGGPAFDLVIFDEASQVRPVDALGRYSGARQAVVVGDSRQLPPTSFFDRLTAGDDHDSEDDDESAPSGDVESILGLFAAMGAPERWLRWHYRSRHESLIAVSNREFYDDRLVIFPSPDAGRREAGLVLRPVADSAYDRGGSRTNPVEAEAVARAVMEHARVQLSRPAEGRLSLGVAAFSVAQMEAIRDRLERLRRDDPSSEPFFAPGGPEPFFVKNLETVQGDERDVIFISVGYGRTADGELAMAFGPLNGDGGERRLNVLITRARLRCEVFTGLTADDIDLTRTQSRGIRALKTFLAYAQGRPLDGLSRGQGGGRGCEPASDFDRAVASALAAEWCDARPPTGPGASAFDLAVADPERPGRSLLAIVGDGPGYAAARSARDRDRLRPQVLRSLGWRLRHVWSTDWVRNPEGERRRLLAALEEPSGSEATPEPGPDATSTVPFPDTIRAEPFPANGRPDPSYERESGSPAEAGPEPDPAPTLFPRYRLAQLPDDLGGRDLATVPTDQLAGRVADVVAAESPVHVDEVARRVADAAGVKRLAGRVQSAIDAALSHAIDRVTVRRTGDFLWHPAMQTPAVRDRGALPAPSRKLDLIAPEEVAQAAEAVVAASFGIEPDALPAAVGRALGFARIGDEFRERVEAIVETLTEEGRLATQGGQLVAAAPRGNVEA